MTGLVAFAFLLGVLLADVWLKARRFARELETAHRVFMDRLENAGR
jgi:hypothetical protein